MGSILRLLSWPLRKLAFAALLAVLGLTGAGLWIFLHESESFESGQRRAAQELTAENLRLKAAVVDADHRMTTTRTEIAARQLRADQAAKIARDLDELGSGLNRITTSSDQLKENDNRSEHLKQLETDSRKRAVDLDQNLIRIQWEKDGMEIALERNQTKLATATTVDSPVLYYAERAWIFHGKKILLGVVLLMLGPPLWRAWRFCRT